MTLRAFDSFRYAFGRNLIPLYLAVIVGWAVMVFSGRLPVDLSDFYITTITLFVFILGFAIMAGGIVGILHQVVLDVKLRE